ncbi:MAG: Ig-like domain-containing protein [Ignavibacteriales bacterium]|nr:Ig-like domain-containing protein [Ignavibacteriales bacterium]
MAKKSIINTYIVILTGLILFNCANPLPPGGGEIDKIPPEVVEVYPPNGTTNFSGDEIEISLSEWCDKRSVQNAIFISPQINILEYSWTGKTLTISFDDTLKPNTTYTVTVGTDIEDLNNRNKMTEAFNFVFSTGSKIDICQVNGNVYDKEQAGIMIYAYKKNGEDITPSEIKPNYLTQVGTNGNYKLLGLSEGEYRIFAIRDKFRDLIYDVEEDDFGVPFSDIFLSEKDSIFTGLNYLITTRDTTKPHLINVTNTDKNNILVECSEPINISKLSTLDFYIYDSTNDGSVDIKYLFKGKAKDNFFFLSFKNDFNEDDELFLIANKLIDMSNNITENERVELVPNVKPDTSYPKIFKTETDYGNNLIDYDSATITLYLDEGFNTKEQNNLIQFVNKSNQIFNSEINYPDDATMNIKIIDKLKQKEDYKLKVDFSKIVDAAGNKIDSVFSFDFNTVSETNFSGVSGKIIKKGTEKVVVILQSILKEGRNYKYNCENSNFKFEKVIPGDYFLWSFIDKNEDGEYNFGEVLPFQPAEVFTFHPDTISLRARWPIEDVIIKFE